jgi:hypothetical protein
VGYFVGLEVGGNVGYFVGLFVGGFVGVFVGLDVGAGVGITHDPTLSFSGWKAHQYEVSGILAK